MTLRDRLYHTHFEPDGEQVVRLRNPISTDYTVEVRPPRNQSLPASLEGFVRGIQELQTRWFGLKNASPVITLEIRRTTSDSLRFQFSVPTKRLERKLRAQLPNEIPDVDFDDGVTGLPVTEEDSIGGGLLTVGRRDWYPLQTEFQSPPINSLTGALHRHAMQRTTIIVQILFQPVIGQPLRSWWRTRRTYQHIGFLRKEKEKLWGSRSPTPREKKQADAIEAKAGTTRWKTSIRFLIIGAEEYTASRVKELAGAFNVYENPATGQYLNAVTVRSIRTAPIYRFCRAAANREFAGWSRAFHASTPELAALVSLPDRAQDNLNNSHP